MPPAIPIWPIWPMALAGLVDMPSEMGSSATPLEARNCFNEALSCLAGSLTPLRLASQKYHHCSFCSSLVLWNILTCLTSISFSGSAVGTAAPIMPIPVPMPLFLLAAMLEDSTLMPLEARNSFNVSFSCLAGSLTPPRLESQKFHHISLFSSPDFWNDLTCVTSMSFSGSAEAMAMPMLMGIPMPMPIPIAAPLLCEGTGMFWIPWCTTNCFRTDASCRAGSLIPPRCESQKLHHCSFSSSPDF
mmetsp:Transcript_59815/g.129589  ORF Transcript_59815/g.129589 Transcript_59815/m.129589 type:complete len:245 (+) Transcript_59815:346-1080(+)